MTETIIKSFQDQFFNRQRRVQCLIVFPVCLVLMTIGCVHVPPQQQRLVSKPNMQFSDSAIFRYQDNLLTQVESGSASSTGGKAGDCGSCVGGGQ
jgi:hypothetical protein